MGFELEYPGVHTCQEQKREFYPEVNAVIGGRCFRPEEKGPGYNHQDKTRQSHRHYLFPHDRNWRIPQSDTHQTKIEPAKGSHRQRNAEQMNTLDDRKYPDRLAYASANLAVVEPLAEALEDGAGAAGLRRDRGRHEPDHGAHENRDDPSGVQTPKDKGEMP